MRLHLDYETASECPLKTAGAHKYAAHPTTRVLMLAWSLDDGPIHLWEPHKDLLPGDLYALLLDPNVTKIAFNATFERMITKCVLGIDIPVDQWRCTMVSAYYLGFAGGLDSILEAVGLESKDKRGGQLINLFSTPAPKNHKATWYTHENKPDEWQEFCEYCIQDVNVERQLWHWLQQYPTMSDWDWTRYQLDQKINDRGVPMNVDMAYGALEMWDTEKESLVDELKSITGLPKVTRDPFKAWLIQHGCNIDNLQGDTLKGLASRQLTPPHVKSAISVWLQKESKAVSKYSAVINGTCDDGRARGMFQFKGASRTDRTSGRRIQLQNLKRPFCAPEWTHSLVTNIERGIRDGVRLVSGRSVSDALGGSIRHAIRAPEGKRLVVCDLTSIESVVLGWLSDCDLIDETFRSGRDSYRVFASQYFGVRYDEVTKEQRAFSKPPVLGAGYMLGWRGLIAYAEGYGVEMDEMSAKRAVHTFRNMYPEIPRFWDWIDTATKVVTQTGRPVDGYRLHIERDADFMRIWLPSGRALSYYKPEVRQRPAPWDSSQMIDNMSYMGSDDKTTKWVRQFAHAGLFTENCIAHGTEVLTDTGWKRIQNVTLLDRVHDGLEFVNHKGLLYKGVQTVVTVDGVKMTPDHEVLTNDGWKTASENPEPSRFEIREAEDIRACGRAQRPAKMGVQVRMRGRVSAHLHGTDEGFAQRQHPTMCVLCTQSSRRPEENAWHDTAPRVRCVEIDAGQMPSANTPILAQLRGQGHTCVHPVERKFSKLLGRHGADLRTRSVNRKNRREWGLLPRELHMDTLQPPITKQKVHRNSANVGRPSERRRCLREVQLEQNHSALPSEKRMAAREDGDTGRQAKSRVYDLLNAGPRHRFVVRGSAGPFVVHNCVQSIAMDILFHGLTEADKYGLTPVLQVHDEIGCEEDEDTADEKLELLRSCMTNQPSWCQDMWLGADGYTSKYYRKD